MVNRNPSRFGGVVAHPIERDFSDRVQGEDLEFWASDEGKYQIIHKENQRNAFLPSKILSKFTATQLVTMSGAASGFLAGVVVCPLMLLKRGFRPMGR